MKFFWILYAKWNNWQINLNVFLHSYYQHQIAIFYFCIGNTIGILTDNVLAATYNLSCLWIPVSHAVVEWFFSQVTSVFKMWKSCDFECVQDRYQCCVIFACFKLRSWCFFNSPVVALVHGLLGLSTSLRLRYILENASLLCIFVPPLTVPLHLVVNSGSFLWTLSLFIYFRSMSGLFAFMLPVRMTWIKQLRS